MNGRKWEEITGVPIYRCLRLKECVSIYIKKGGWLNENLYIFVWLEWRWCAGNWMMRYCEMRWWWYEPFRFTLLLWTFCNMSWGVITQQKTKQKEKAEYKAKFILQDNRYRYLHADGPL